MFHISAVKRLLKSTNRTVLYRAPLYCNGITELYYNCAMTGMEEFVLYCAISDSQTVIQSDIVPSNFLTVNCLCSEVV